jgi:predicted Zn-ribbon and HTH transcriptional regulator
MTKKVIKPRQCRRCGVRFMPSSRLVPWCPECKRIAYKEYFESFGENDGTKDL